MILEPIEFMGLNFYSRASARRDLFARNAIIHSEQFLLTRLCEARLAFCMAFSLLLYFYSRASARRDLVRLGSYKTYEDFYSRASARRDGTSRWTTREEIRISTHAPLRGATTSICFYFQITDISTHAPLRGATHLPPRARHGVDHFYSRASARRDRLPL